VSNQDEQSQFQEGRMKAPKTKQVQSIGKLHQTPELVWVLRHVGLEQTLITSLPDFDFAHENLLGQSAADCSRAPAVHCDGVQKKLH
jgi:hypothetical protein